MKNKLEVLKYIADKFNKANIRYCFGASIILYFKGIVDKFNDIDILFVDEDYNLVKETLSDLGELKQYRKSEQFKSEYFLEAVIDEVEVDAFANFNIIYNNQENCFPLDISKIEYFDLDGIKIPLDSLDNWHNYYHLMGRDNKVALIDDYNKKHIL